MKKILLLGVALLATASVWAKTKVACIGDSITFGYTLPNREAVAYPTQLQQLLDEKFPGEYEVRNFGNSGRGIYLDSMRGKEKRGWRYMKEHDAALAFKPDIVICNLGINDNGEYIKEYTGGRKRGQFVEDYMTLLADFKKANKKTKFFIWTKLSPLTQGQKFYRSPEPFLMQADLEEVARRCKAVGIDMQEPLRADQDAIFAKDHIHPDAAGAKIIAETTFAALEKARTPPAKNAESARLEERLEKKGEIWLCAGQSNMQQGWDVYNRTPEEKARYSKELAQLDKAEVWMWDVNDGKVGEPRVWKRLTPANAGKRSALGVSFAIRRALATKKPVGILYVAAGGAPTESFLSEQVMCQVDKKGNPIYPALCKIATNRHQIQANDDFPCAWCKREFLRRKGKAEEAAWWPVSRLHDEGLKRVADLKLTGILWYQGESNATTNVKPDVPLADDYMLETNLAIIDQLRGEKKIPFIMMGLPKMNRPWEPYRAAQKKACEEKGAIFVDTFGAGLGTPNDVHPRNKIPFVELALKALAEKSGKR